MASRNYGDTLGAPRAQSMAERVAFALRHSGLHSAKAVGPTTVTIQPPAAHEAWQTEQAVASLVEAAAHVQRTAWALEVDTDGVFTLELGERR